MRDSYGPLRVEVEAGVATVVIDHPPLHLVDTPFLTALGRLLDDVPGSGVRVAVFRSADPDFFLMHGDVRTIRAMPAVEGRAERPNAAAATFARLSAGPAVTVAMVDGAARGGGAEFLHACDLRYGSVRAVFAQPEAAMGILPGAGGTARLPRLLGRSRALDIILTGRDVAAEEAAALGWLTALVPGNRLEAHTYQVARLLAGLPPEAVSAVRRVVDLALPDIGPALLAETEALGGLLGGAEVRARMGRFLDAGGQTREGETTRMAAIMTTMLDGAAADGPSAD